MEWLKRILSIKTKPTRATSAARPNPMALDLPDDPGGTRVQRPKVRGRTPEERAADLAEYHRQLQVKGRATFERDRSNAMRVGSVKYRWRSCGDFNTCRRCAKNNGRLFSWDVEPPGGHPGCGTDCSDGACRCYAEAVIR